MKTPTQQSITDLYNELVASRDRLLASNLHSKEAIAGGIEIALDRIAMKFSELNLNQTKKI